MRSRGHLSSLVVMVMVVVVVVGETFFSEIHATAQLRGGGGGGGGGEEGGGRGGGKALEHVTLGRRERAITKDTLITSAAPSSAPRLSSLNAVTEGTGRRSHLATSPETPALLPPTTSPPTPPPTPPSATSAVPVLNSVTSLVSSVPSSVSVTPSSPPPPLSVTSAPPAPSAAEEEMGLSTGSVSSSSSSSSTTTTTTTSTSTSTTTTTTTTTTTLASFSLLQEEEEEEEKMEDEEVEREGEEEEEEKEEGGGTASATPAGEVTDAGLGESRGVTLLGTGEGRWLRVLALLRGDCGAVNMSDTRRVFGDFVASLSSLLLYGRESVAVQAMACEGQRLAVNLTINAAQHPSCEADLATLASHRNLRVGLHGASFYLEAVHTERSHVFHTRPGRRQDGMRFLYMALGGVGVSVACVALAGVVFAVYQHCAARRAKLVFTDDRSAYTPASSCRGRVRRGEADHHVRFADSHSFKVNMYRSYSDLNCPDLFPDVKDPEAKARTRRTREEVWEESFSHTSQEYTSVRGVSDLTSSFRSDEPTLHPLLLNGRPNPAGDVLDTGARTPKTADKPGPKPPGAKPGPKPGAKPGVTPKPGPGGKPGGKPGTEEGRPGGWKGEAEGRREKAPIPPLSSPPGSPAVARGVLERMDHLFASALTASVPDMDLTPTHATVSVSELYSFTTLAASTTTSTSSLYTHAPTPRPDPARTAGGEGGEDKAPPPVSASNDSLCLTRITFMEMCVWPDSPRAAQGKRREKKGGTCQEK